MIELRAQHAHSVLPRCSCCWRVAPAPPPPSPLPDLLSAAPSVHRDVSPTTQMPLPHKMLTPNAVLRSSLVELLRSAGVGSLAC